MKQKIESQNALQKGVLYTWNDEKGFGFILPENCGKNIFIHISAFGRISRRPKVGDIVYYHLKITSNQKGKSSAYNATIEGVKKEPKRLSKKPARKRISFWKMIAGFMVFFIIFVYGISKIRISSKPPQIETPALSSQSQQYHCAGKVHCSEMDSCEEAKYYLRNCPGVKIDGDGNGMPCEQQHCRY
jgi:cold shock CspA family protein